MSDLHLETQPWFQPSAAPGVDVLVLAGDIGSYQSGSRLADADFGLAHFSPIRPGALWPRVLYVPGNHEFDGLERAEAYERLRATCQRLGIDWLEGQVLRLGGVRFIGSTLWADFDALVRSEMDPTQRLRIRDKAYRAANYYLRKNTTLQQGQPMLAEQLRELALASQAWLRQALAQPFAGTTVVVTHFAPTLHSVDPRYGLTPGTAGFCNALDGLLPHADLWVHGHLHCRNDHTVRGTHQGRPYTCRIVANPLGYHGKGEHEAFRPDWVIDLAD